METKSILKKFTIWICILSILNLSSCTVLLPGMVVSKNDLKLNPQEVRNRIKNKSDALNEWGTPPKIDTLGGLEIWTYDVSSLRSRTSHSGGFDKGQGLPFQDNPQLSSKNIQIHFEGDQVAYWRFNGIESPSKQDRLAAGMLRSIGMVIDGAIVILAVFVLSVSSDPRGQW
jgi:hypothetical protein